jgi:hypothetical protein
VIVGVDQVVALRAVGEMRIAERENLVERRRHGGFPQMSARMLVLAAPAGNP